MKKLRDPTLPSDKEVEDHWFENHVNYRGWCDICARASRGKERDCPRHSVKSRELSESSWDYCFPGDELGFKWTVLVGKERNTRAILATAVPEKGSTGMFAVDKCMCFINEVGDEATKVIIKTDQEPAMKYLVDEIVRGRPNGQTLVEEAQKGSGPLAARGAKGTN